MTTLSIEYLADHPDAAPVLAGWFAREWGAGSAQRTAAAFSTQLASCADRDRLPICLVGLLDTEPVATATLKFREIEYSEEADFWIGWVCVREDMRGRGFGRDLVTAAEAQAAARRLTPLYLHTPGKEAFYRHLGWQTIGLTTADGKPSTVMTKTVSGA
ncbi:MAG TPA: GNAT family N-acetyltransferase [Thermoleophilia bacterium]